MQYKKNHSLSISSSRTACFPAYAAFLILMLIIVTVAASKASAGFLITEDISGGWYDITQDGAGLSLEILDGDRAVVTWYTYDTNGNQVWLIGVGIIDGNRIVAEQVRITSGGIFGMAFNPGDVQRSVWGQLELTFSDCNNAELTYSGPPAFGSGSQQLQRLTTIRELPCDGKRQVRLGFTPFPSELPGPNGELLLSTYAKISADADIIAHHLDDGIPWPEAAAGASVDNYPGGLQADWNFRRVMTPPSHKVYVAITPISLNRDSLAPYRGEQPDTPLTVIGEPWVSAAFNDEIVKQAFLNHAINAVEFFRPDFLAIGIEANLFRQLAPAAVWPDYLELHRETYQALKQRYPSLPVLITLTANELLEGFTTANASEQAQVLADIEDFTDILGISWYPFLSNFGTGELPSDTYRRLDALTDKPIAITETGYPAEFQRLEIAAGVTVELDGTEAKQNAFIEDLLAAADSRRFRFVIQFTLRDYDTLCDQLQCRDFSRIWQDTGLWDQDDITRPALIPWRNLLQKPLAN